MYFSVQQIADTLGISKKTVFRYIKSGNLRAAKIGQWKIKPSDFQKFLNKHFKSAIKQNHLKIIRPQYKTVLEAPLFLSAVPAGFPSPADDFIEEQLDLNKHLIKNQPATFFVRAIGDSMTGAGIFNGDILIVDRSLEAHEGKIVIAAVDGEFTVKRMKKINGKLYLMPENENHKPIAVSKSSDFSIWGVVTNVIHKL